MNESEENSPLVQESSEIPANSSKLFVELDEVDKNTQAWQWHEKARWLKFEELVLGSAERWGPPQVPSLSFHSLSTLSKQLETRFIALDVEISDSSSLFSTAVNKLAEAGHLSQTDVITLQAVLASRTSSAARQPTVSISVNNDVDRKLFKDVEAKEVDINLNRGVYRRRSSILHPSPHYNMELMEKLPDGCELASVLVGTLTDLEKPCIGLVRLKSSIKIENMAELPLPIRYLFVCFGPPIKGINYFEIGRSMGCLLSNQKFNYAVSQAKETTEVLAAVNAFLDESMVLPPGDFDQQTLIPILYTARQRKREKALKKQELSQDGVSKMVKSNADKDDQKDDPLKRTRRPFGGLIRDIKRRYPRYWSDIKDSLSPQVLATVLFIYFTAVSPAITFGGLLDSKVNGYMGASESLLATAASGILFAVFCGQPLIIVGLTGPLLVFEEGIYKFAVENSIDYLSWRFWIGIWMGIISVIFVAAEGSIIVKYLTRFMQEIFAIMISLIFIYETFANLVAVFIKHPLCWDYETCWNKMQKQIPFLPHLDSSNTSWVFVIANHSSSSNASRKDVEQLVQPNISLLTLALTLFTFSLAYYFRGIRNKKILGRTIRRSLGDFGVPLSILIFCIIDYLIGDTKYTAKLDVPETFSVSKPELRGWLVNPLGQQQVLQPYHFASAAIPALLGTILMYIETLITSVLVDKKENKLTKGTGFHLDVLLLGIISAIHGVFGLPFVSGATVRSVAHVSALTVITTKVAPGEQPRLERVIEQRVSSLLVAGLVGASMFLGMVLKFIPMAVLFGVFLYMGVSSLGGLQLYQRLVLLITPKKHHPLDVGYVRYVRAWKMHLFTIIQVLCVGLLWGIRASPGSLAFPFALILMVPFRLFVMKYMFKDEELRELDKAGSPAVVAEDKPGQEDEPDFFEQAHMPM